MDFLTYLTKDGLLYFWTLIKQKFVAKEDGKSLMTDAEREKLSNIEENANNYTLPAATATVLGGVKTGTNITNNAGTISVTKANVTGALGYTPPTAAEVQAAVSAAGHLKRTIVEVLPIVSGADPDTIYMVKENENSADNKYVEYMVIDGNWERIGSTDVDLTPYVKHEDLVAITNAEIDAIVAG